MRVSLAIAWKETHAYFTSPMGYIVALVFLAWTGFWFAEDITGLLPEARVQGFINWPGASFILILLAPAMTMRLLAEEQKLGTMELLLTAPVRDWEVVLGKFLASMVFFLTTLFFTLFYVILLYAFGSPDSGPIWSAYLGLILYGAAALAIGLLASSMTNNQIVALVVGFGILLILFVLDLASGQVEGLGSTILSEVGMRTHLSDFSRGIVSTWNIVYYVALITVVLFLTVRIVETRRWR